MVKNRRLKTKQTTLRIVKQISKEVAAGGLLEGTRSDWLQNQLGPQQLRAIATSVEPILPTHKASHEEMLSRIAIVEALMAEMPKKSVGIGRNQPPPITRKDVEEINVTLASLKAQPTKAKSAALTLMNIGGRLAICLDICLLEASKSAGKELGKRLVRWSYWYLLLDALIKLAQSRTGSLH